MPILPVILPVKINDQPVRIGQQKRFVVRKVVHFQHNSRSPRLKLRDPDFLQEAVIYVKALAHESGSQLGATQVKEDALRMGDSLRTELNAALQVNRDAGVIRRGPVPDSGYARVMFGMGVVQTRFGRFLGSYIRLQ